ncbi:olfactory receptor 2D2-like [Ascaphus truei]|uniref:olfactory receptor 2D2-like n=1 Tax=Ascaphus truei TaxID=8439 RepID=UPI003F5AC245
MERGNHSTVTEFILLGLSSDPKIQVLLFQLFLSMYLVTLAGNLLLIVAVRTDLRLHTSMYFFLTHLSFLDICYTSIVVPKMLVDFLTQKKIISFSGCMAQIFLYIFLGGSECVLLAFMAFDRFVAICNPLRYSRIMNKMACIKMATVSWMTGCIISSVDVFFICRLTYCGPNIINHFFCEALSLHLLSCRDLYLNNIVTLVGGAILLLIPLFLILFSYIHMIAAIVRIRSNRGRYKVFSTCASHLIIVTLFYGTAMFTYMQPGLRHSAEATDKFASVVYIIATPMINPLIYSLRNEDVQGALRRLRRCTVIM